jgi:hypothetical protein
MIWGWHIWACNEQPGVTISTTPYTAKDKDGDGNISRAEIIANGKMNVMDRNIGATYAPKTVTEVTNMTAQQATDALGLYFQAGNLHPYPRPTEFGKGGSADNSWDTWQRSVYQYGFTQYTQSWTSSGGAKNTLADNWQFPYYRYSATFRHYVPIVKNDILTFAYRLNYEGTMGESAPYYILPYITTMGQTYDRDGMGGYRTIRGLMRNRVQGLDMFSYNAEIRWRFVSFGLWKQNIAFGLNLFSDGTMVTREYDMSFRGDESSRASYDEYMAMGADHDRMHITVGAGLRFIMNQNFIVAFEYGLPISRFSSDPVIKNQDGKGAFYINTGYLF